MTRINLAGQKFGKLVCSDYFGRNNHNQHEWVCKCDCGKVVRVLEDKLINGIQKTCGCKNKRIDDSNNGPEGGKYNIGRRTYDFIGTRVGKLVVVEAALRGWNCVCDCGKTTFANSWQLQSGRKKSCGCGHVNPTRNKHINQTHKKVVDIAGNRFGKLIVIGYFGVDIKDKSQRALWLTRCDCGNYSVVRGDNLRSGRSKSCGCFRMISSARNIAIANAIAGCNLQGERFDRFFVVKKDDRNNRGETTWVCQCDCGNFKLVSTRYLTRGDTRSCGCLARASRRKDRTGQRFGRLVVLFPFEYKKEYEIRMAVWVCQCDCGNFHIVNSRNLVGGHVKSCGCLAQRHRKSFGQVGNEAKILVNKILEEPINQTRLRESIKTLK